MNLNLPPVVISAQIEKQWQEFCAANDPAQRVLEAAPAICCLWEQSRFCMRLCMRYPEWIERLLDDEGEHPHDYAVMLNEWLDGSDDEVLVKQKLREFRNLQMLLICWRDLVCQQHAMQVLHDTSALADACICAALDWLQTRLAEKFGEPLNESGQTVKIMLVALGKLGGWELNFSSDIDVMLCYASGGNTRGARSISNQEFFTKVAQQFIKLLADTTEHGFVYRVDCRLRPFGDSGPLVVNFNHLEDYYLTHGREWERYALIKARVVYGDTQDVEVFENIINAFVYRRYIDFGVIETLRSMKGLIEQQVKKNNYRNHLKLGAGGIREIEFIAQFFQLIRGGKQTQLQTRSLLTAMQEITRAGYLSAEEVDCLKHAYFFLRRAENRVQMYDDQQKHELPEGEKLTVLAQSMGFADAQRFDEALQKHMTAVSHAFAGICGAREDEPQVSEDIYALAWKAISGEDAATADEAVAPDGFKDWQQVCHKLYELTQSLAFRSQDQISRERLSEFMPVMLRKLHAVPEPLLVLERLSQLLITILRRSAYLVLLMESEHALDQLLQVVAASPWIANHIAAYPLLLDELSTLNENDVARSLEQLQQQFNEQILLSPQQDYEHILERVRAYKHAHELRVACADVQGHLPVMQVSDQLSWLAESIIHGCVEYLEHDDEALPNGNLAVIAFGKLGGIELSYGSDLDLVFVSNDEKSAGYGSENKVPYTVKMTRTAQKLTQMLALQTVSGRMYEVDSRLRPDGASGPLVPTFAFMEQYYQSRAWTWELQALVRARCVAGPQEMHARFEHLRRMILTQPRDSTALAGEVVDMRKKMLNVKKSKSEGLFDLKNDVGGITDIEFMVQYAVLANASKDAGLCAVSDNVRLLERLSDSGVLAHRVATELTDIYCRYRNNIHHLALQANKTQVDATQYVEERDTVRRHWQELLTAPV